MALTRIYSAGIQSSPTFSGVSTFTGNVSFGASALFGNNDKLLTTLTIEGVDSGARTTIPVEITKEVIATSNTQGQTGVQLT